MRPGWRHAAGIAASAVLLGLYARGEAFWWLGFVALAPWLAVLDAARSWRGALLGGCAMSVALAAAAFSWFGEAIGHYTQAGPVAGVALLLLAAPLFQPQVLVFALVRHLARARHGMVLGALAAAAAWVAAEWAIGKMLGDTLGHGLHPSRLMRQAAELGGAAGLTLVLLLCNEAWAALVARRREGLRALARPLLAAAIAPALLAGYGAAVLASPEPAARARPLRVGLVQSNIVDYERLRREQGAGAVVRQVLDLHFAMSYDAVERQRADAVLWSETVYPTTFGRPKSEAGAELDREILATVEAAGVPFVFGTYDRDAAGEYNAAAFVSPGRGLVGAYRKTRLFPFTEQVPPWLDGPRLRRWLPWTGHWKPGSGARLFPLALAGGHEVPVLPLICLDDMDPGLAIAGARLGAQAILTMSNDAWFSGDAHGARLHRAAAAFRSIETRLPQFRVTTNGFSAVIDASGEVVAGSSAIGERMLVVGELPVREPPRTLMVAWGDWVGPAAAMFLLLLLVAQAMRRMRRSAALAPAAGGRAALPARVAVLPPAARVAAGALRAFARGALLWMLGAVLWGDANLQAHTLAQVRLFAIFFLAPEAAAWCVMLAYSARASIEDGQLVLARGSSRLALALHDIAAVQPWRLPVPAAGVSLRLVSGGVWRHGLVHPDPLGLAGALTGAAPPAPVSRAMTYAQARQAVRRGRLDRSLAKFVLFPLLLAIPAFRLHQHIAYGGAFGQLDSAGLGAYVTTFALWWAAWTIGMVLFASALRAAIEAGTVAAVLVRPARAADARRWLERVALAVLYLGVPAWMALRLLGS